MQTAPDGVRLVVVKVETSEPGLYGLGCATFTQRPLAVVEAAEKYLDPFLRGRDVDEIEDIFQAAQMSSYWRSGPVLNNALSGVDMALWDIKGKRAGMPVYSLLGGKCRMAAPVYVHAHGRDITETIEQAHQHIANGFRHVRLQTAVPGQSTYGTTGDLQTHTNDRRPDHSAQCLRTTPPTCASSRSCSSALATNWATKSNCCTISTNVCRRPWLCSWPKPSNRTDCSSSKIRCRPRRLATFARCDNTRTFPSPWASCSPIRRSTCGLIQDRLIDFIRIHLSQIGGLTMGRKVAALCEFFGVRTAWHGPSDTSPIGHAANVALDLTCHNFGIQELMPAGPATQDVFPGCLQPRDGCLWANEAPGWGIDVDETLARKFPYPEHPYNGAWPAIRRADGSVVRP